MSRLVVPALLALLSACRDTTEPSSGTIELRVLHTTEPELGTGSDSLPTISCGFGLAAQNTGTRAIPWQDGQILLYIGQDRNTPVDSAPIAASQFADVMGGATVPAGGMLEGGVRLIGGAPFTIVLVFRYGPPTSVARSSRVTLHCGPRPDPAVAAPQMTVTSLTAPSPLEAGDTITISYQASSTIGVWLSVVELTGACTLERFFPERLQANVSRVVRIQLPAGCTPDASLAVRAAAADGLLQGRFVEPPPLTVVDQTPPTIYFTFLPLGHAITGLFFPGDTIRARVSAADNSGVRWFRWEVLPFGTRDSVAVSGSPASTELAIPILPQWNGLISLRIDAKDATGLISTPLLSVPDSLAVAPTVVRPTVTSSVPGAVFDFALDARRHAAYLSVNLHSTSVLTINTDNGTHAPAMHLPSYSMSLDLTPGGDTLVVSLPTQGALGLVDLTQATRQVVLLPLTALDSATQQAERVRVGANRHAYVLVYPRPPAYTGTTGILDVDLATGAQRFLAGTLGAELGTFDRSGDGKVFVFTRYGSKFQRYDVGTGKLGPLLEHGSGHLTSFDETGSRVALVHWIYDGSLQLEKRVWSTENYGAANQSTSLTPDGAYLYQAVYARGLLRTRVSDGMVVDRTTLPFPIGHVRVSPDGRFAVVIGNNNLAQDPGTIAFVTLP